jgi:hypothetical protein
MNIPGYDQNPPEMQGGAMDDAAAGEDQNEDQTQGDGLHHHEIHEDEGGGFHSVHTFPDGHTDEADHVDYDEAKAKQDQDFGQGDMSDDSGGGEDGGEDGDSSFGDDEGDDAMTNIAKSYGSRASH